MITPAHVCALFLLSGCGRFGFGARPSDDASTAPIEAEIAIDARLASDAPMFTLDAGECPPTYQVAGSSCYRLHVATKVFWLDAELACEADAVGAHLATIDNAAEATLITNTFTETDYWVGMSDRVTEDSYRNVTGEAAPYLVWTVNEPSSSDCAQFDSDALFHVSACDTTDEYLCEFDGRPAAAGAY